MATDKPLNQADALDRAAQQMINGYPDLAQAIMDHYLIGMASVRERIGEVYGTRGALWLREHDHEGRKG